MPSRDFVKNGLFFGKFWSNSKSYTIVPCPPLKINPNSIICLNFIINMINNHLGVLKWNYRYVRVILAIILPTRTETVLKSVRSWMFPQHPMLWWRLFIIMVEVSVLATIRVTFFYPDTAFLCNDNQILALDDFSQLSDSVYMVFYSRYVSGTSWV